jgi:hypothetical protein
MSFTFSEKKATRFRLEGEHLATLLKGDVVRIEKTSGDPVEFFLADIGINELYRISDEELSALSEKLTGDHNG